MSLPFGLSLPGLVEQIFKTAGGYPYLSVNAWNPWALVTFQGSGLAQNRGWVCDMVVTSGDSFARCAQAFSFGRDPGGGRRHGPDGRRLHRRQRDRRSPAGSADDPRRPGRPRHHLLRRPDPGPRALPLPARRHRSHRRDGLAPMDDRLRPAPGWRPSPTCISCSPRSTRATRGSTTGSGSDRPSAPGRALRSRRPCRWPSSSSRSRSCEPRRAPGSGGRSPRAAAIDEAGGRRRVGPRRPGRAGTARRAGPGDARPPARRDAAATAHGAARPDRRGSTAAARGDAGAAPAGLGRAAHRRAKSASSAGSGPGSASDRSAPIEPPASSGSGGGRLRPARPVDDPRPRGGAPDRPGLAARRAVPDALRRGLPPADGHRVPPGLALRASPTTSTSGPTPTSRSTRWRWGSSPGARTGRLPRASSASRSATRPSSRAGTRPQLQQPDRRRSPVDRDR